MVSKFIRNTKKMKGQAMAEFALTIPVFLLLVFGIIELSRFFLVYSSVFTAVREATRYGSSVGDGEIPNYQNCEMITETAVRMGNFGGVQTEDVTVYFESQPGTWVADCDLDDDPEDRYQPVLGDRVVVEIDTDYDSVLGIVPDLTVNAENGRTIMLGVQSQIAVVTTEEPEGESTPEPTEDTTTPEPTEDTTTPEPTEDTTTPEPTEDTSTPVPTEDPTEEIICPDLSDFSHEIVFPNNNKNSVNVNIYNNSEEDFNLVKINGLRWTKEYVQNANKKFTRFLDDITWGGVNIYNIRTEPPPVSSLNITPSNQVSIEDDTVMIFYFDQDSRNINIEFELEMENYDDSCQIFLNISNYP